MGEATEGHDHPDGSPAPAIMLADEPAVGLNPAASVAPPDLTQWLAPGVSDIGAVDAEHSLHTPGSDRVFVRPLRRRA